MPRVYRRRRMPYGELARWMAICLPVGLYHLWHERYRWHWSVKLLISITATALTACMLAGALSLFGRPNPVMAQPTTSQFIQQDIYPLVVEADDSMYHLEGCVYAKPGTLPIRLSQAASQNIPADELCNPPRYNNRN
ncbi:MAG: hypothetical protein FWD25_01890 [Clostridia bacterium]|nr:hypothetical protein [Clostridia bacterium]